MSWPGSSLFPEKVNMIQVRFIRDYEVCQVTNTVCSRKRWKTNVASFSLTELVYKLVFNSRAQRKTDAAK